MDTIEFFTIGVSVRLSDRSLHSEEQKRFVKNCPQYGLKPGPPNHQANALPTELTWIQVYEDICSEPLLLITGAIYVTFDRTF